MEKLTPLQSYIKEQIQDLEDRLEEIAVTESRYQRQRNNIQRQLSLINVKLAGIKEFTKDYSKQLAAAKRKLEETNQ